MVKKTEKNLTKKSKTVVTKDYAQTLAELKRHVQEAQIRATFAVNKQLLLLYWSFGKTIAEKQDAQGWGSKIIEKLAEDLQSEFPGIAGFSRANIFRMHPFYRAYEIVSTASRQLEELPIFNIPWWHNIVLLMKLKDNNQRLWYAQKAMEHGWSRTILEMQIESELYNRQGKSITNFKNTLPQPDSDMAQQTLKDPYIFDFLTLHEKHREHDIEQGLIDNVQKLLLEMGKGFALVGRQYHLVVGSKDYYIDLLFYHTKLRCYMVVELEAREFDPGDAGQLNFYLSAVDDLVRDAQDNQTIGLLLCKTKDNFTAEYSLRDINKPIGVSSYKTELVKKLPKELTSTLPTIEEIEAEIEKNEIINGNKTEKKPKKASVKRKVKVTK